MRISYPAPAEADSELGEILRNRPPLNLYRMLPRTRSLAAQFLQMGQTIRTGLVLDAEIRELAIVRTGILTRADYEVHHHRAVALAQGVSVEALDRMIDGQFSSLSVVTQAALAYVDQIVTNVRAEDDVFEAAIEAIGPDAVAELTMVVGFYLMTARFLRNFDIPIEKELNHADWL